MAWLELHQTLPTNKKTLRLKSLLRIKSPQVVGHLCMLWLWALDNAPDGDLSIFTADEIAEVSNWTSDAQKYVDALINAGFIDPNMQLHDWDDYAGKLLEQRTIQREQSRMRQQKRREKITVSHADVTRDNSVSHAGITKSPYPTVPNSTNIAPISPTGVEGEQKKLTIQSERFDAFWTAYPKKVGKEAAHKSWMHIKPTAELQNKILTAITAAKKSDQWQKENGRFIPNPSTWLNQGRWDDEPVSSTKETSIDMVKIEENFESYKVPEYKPRGIK